VFYSDYKDVQIPGSMATFDANGDGKDDGFAGVTTNAGKAKIKGLELEASPT
jgi:iron complex outermembrane receptor protein